MTETQKRIKALKKQLPSAKGKVVAMATSLLLAAVMLTSVSFAWYTMSSAPEVGSMKTTIAANGNLEVALAGLVDEDGNLLEPSKSAVGDSFAAEGQTVVDANLTWGNLINLSNAYGIENLMLRPATFDDNAPAFLTSMLYSDDGRVEMSSNKFDFTTWQETSEGYDFVVPKKPTYGVRAISSVLYQESNVELSLGVADGWFERARNSYKDVIEDDDYIDTIEAVVQIYLNAQVDDYLNDKATDANCSEQIEMLYRMMKALYESVYGNYAQALVALANVKVPTDKYTVETLFAASKDQLVAQGITIDFSRLTQFKKDYDTAKADTDTLEGLYIKNRDEKTPVLWSDISGIVDNLIDIESVQLVDINNNNKRYTVNQILALGGDIISFALGLNKNVPIIINKGMLINIEQLTEHNMYANISFYIMTQLYSKNGQVQTSLRGTQYTGSYYLDRAKIAQGGPVYTGEKKADNTYGMVIDLWVRTNAADSILTLDGLAETVTYYELNKIIPSGSAEFTQAFIYTYYTGDVTEMGEITIEETADVQMFLIPQDVDGDENVSSQDYEMELNGEKVTVTIYEGYFYDTESHGLVPQRDAKGEIVPAKDDEGNIIMEGDKPKPTYLTNTHFWDNDVKIVPETRSYQVVTGFKSPNRVDGEYSSEAESNNEISATQGSGSCYIFYANPEDADSTLKLLSHLKLAFCDINGNLMASARLATEFVYADSGKYIVPIVVEPSSYTYLDEDGEMCYGITTLNKNEAKLISVVVYLDGKDVDNSMVMERGTIQGGLNIQFASNVDLKSLGDTDLSMKTISVKADISGTNDQGQVFENVTNLQMSFNPDDLSKTTLKLKAEVIGVTPTSVQAIFQRQVNATQGAAMPPVTLDADMTADVIFRMPGIYVLRSLWVDGEEYVLPESSWITVTVTGFSVQEVAFCDDEGEDLALTAESVVSRSVAITFLKGEQVNSVSVRFLDEYNKPVDAILYGTNNPNKWSGTVQFRSSGHYVLTYVMVNGETYELPETMRKDFTAYLGLRAEVALQSVDPDVGLSFPFKGTEAFRVFAKILTDTGEEMKNKTDLMLFYGMRGSAIETNGLKTPLTWDVEQGCYTGTFNVIQPGVYSFQWMTIGQNTITKVTTAASIAAAATEPPSYELVQDPLWDNATNKQATGLLIMPNTSVTIPENGRSAYYRIKLLNAGGATSFTAIFVDPTGKETSVIVGDNEGTDPDGSTQVNADGSIVVYFKLPQKNSGDRSGDWTLREVAIDGLYDSKGNPTTYTMKPEAGNLAQFSVLDSLNKDLNAVSVNNTFMTATALKNSENKYLSWKINWSTLSHGTAPAISSVKVTLTHDKTSLSNYYTVDDYSKISSSYTTLSFNLVQNADGTWRAPDAATAALAGNYTYTMEVTLSTGDVFTIRGGNEVALTVVTAKPTAMMTNATPTGEFTTKVNYVGKNASTCSTGSCTFTFSADKSNYISPDKFSAKLYGRAYQSSGTVPDAYFECPKLTIQLSDMGSFDTATLVLNAGTGGATVKTFAYTSTKLSVTLDIGNTGSHTSFKYSSLGGSFDIQKYLGHGYQEITSITIVHGSATFTMPLAHKITIENPSSINQ